MKEVIIELLNKLNNDNYQTYLVGGAVISFFSGTETTDLDFATTMDLSLLDQLFDNVTKADFGGYKFDYKGYHIDITHLRNDIEIKNGYPTKYELTNNLELDAHRRDFTINALYLNQDLKVIDYLDGLSDYQDKIIKPIGDINIIKEDPIRMIRAIRFMVTYRFDLTADLALFIKDNVTLLDRVKKERIAHEIDKIKGSLNYQIYFDQIKEFGLDLSEY